MYSNRYVKTLATHKESELELVSGMQCMIFDYISWVDQT